MSGVCRRDSEKFTGTCQSLLEHDPYSIQQDISRKMLNKENSETPNLNVICYFQIPVYNLLLPFFSKFFPDPEE